MIPGPLVAPPTRALSTTRPVWWAGAWMGAALVAVAVFGAVFWVGAVSPLGFRRFSVFDADRRLEFHQAGTFVIFEEYPGAARPNLAPALDYSVRGDAPVKVEELIDAGQVAAPDAYRDAFGHEGRAVARFTITEPGEYRLRISPKPLGTYDPGDYVRRTRGNIAVGRDVATTVLAGPVGVVVLVVLPLVAGVGLLIATRVARRRARRARPNPAGPLTAGSGAEARFAGPTLVATVGAAGPAGTAIPR